MNEDEHTNVRLAAVEALGKFNTSEVARQALIDALNYQSIPEVHIPIIPILGNFKEKRAAEPAQQLLDKEDVPAYVKDQVRLQLPNLI
jgi:HEAT repeat protein